MYCMKCGKRIDFTESKCSDCGADNRNNEYCGGFWGLVGETNQKTEKKSETNSSSITEIEKAKEISSNNIKKAEVKTLPQIDDRNNSTQKKRSPLLLMGICVMLVIGCLIQTVRISSVSNKYHVYRTKYENLLEEHENLQIEHEELSIQYDCLKQKLTFSNKSIKEFVK